MKRLGWLLAILLIIAIPVDGLAASRLPKTIADEFPWDEIRTEHFAVIFQDDMAELANFIVALFGDQLDSEYLRLSSLFEAELPPPISIRIYPTANQFQKLNADPSSFDPESTHAHVGTREIAIIVGNLSLTTMISVQNQERVLNDLRYELAHLFVAEISSAEAPPGLAVGVATYAQDPLGSPDIGEGISAFNPGGVSSWPEIWESRDASLDRDLRLQAMSTVSFLVDHSGWPAFIQFMKRIPASENYQQALEETYQLGLSALESKWRGYLPHFKADRWQSNALHGIDLGVHSALIEAGAYSEANRLLDETITVIEQAGDEELLGEAQQLQQTAELGVEAYALLRRSRQSILEGKFEAALAFLGQARSTYRQIDDDRYMDDIDLYAARAEEALALREELVAFQNQADALTDTEMARLVSTAERLGELGDADGYSTAKQILERASARRYSRLLIISAILVLASLGLIAHRIYLIRREVTPESSLL